MPAINCLFQGKKLWLMISPKNIKVLVGDSILEASDVTLSANKVYGFELLEKLNKYDNSHKITVWIGCQRKNTTCVVPPMYLHCTSSVCCSVCIDCVDQNCSFQEQ